MQWDAFMRFASRNETPTSNFTMIFSTTRIRGRCRNQPAKPVIPLRPAWAAVQPVLDAWAQDKPADFPNYRAGTAGPDSANALIARDGRAWKEIR